MERNFKKSRRNYESNDLLQRMSVLEEKIGKLVDVMEQMTTSDNNQGNMTNNPQLDYRNFKDNKNFTDYRSITELIADDGIDLLRVFKRSGIFGYGLIEDLPREQILKIFQDFLSKKLIDLELEEPIPEDLDMNTRHKGIMPNDMGFSSTMERRIRTIQDTGQDRENVPDAEHNLIQNFGNKPIQKSEHDTMYQKYLSYYPDEYDAYMTEEYSSGEDIENSDIYVNQRDTSTEQNQKNDLCHTQNDEPLQWKIPQLITDLQPNNESMVMEEGLIDIEQQSNMHNEQNQRVQENQETFPNQEQQDLQKNMQPDSMLEELQESEQNPDSESQQNMTQDSQSESQQNMTRNDTPEFSPGNVSDNQIQSIIRVQEILRALSNTNREIPPVVPNGVWQGDTTQGVKVSQEGFGLPVTGEVDRETWEKLVETYNNYIESIRPSEALKPWYFDRESMIGMGSTHPIVFVIQIIINVLGREYSNMPKIAVTGTYDMSTRAAVRMLQKKLALPMTGNVDKKTWNAFVRFYNYIVSLN